jgi:hypothetical protein
MMATSSWSGVGSDSCRWCTSSGRVAHPFPCSILSGLNIGSVSRDDNTAGVDGAVQILTLVLKWILGWVPHPRVYRGWGFSAMFSLLRLIGFVDFGWMLFDDADEGGRLRYIQETKSEAGPKNPTLPLHQNREGWGTRQRHTRPTSLAAHTLGVPSFVGLRVPIAQAVS